MPATWLRSLVLQLHFSWLSFHANKRAGGTMVAISPAIQSLI
jgi:hypothetical protein